MYHQHYATYGSRALDVIVQQETQHLPITQTEVIYRGQGHQRSLCSKRLSICLSPALQPSKQVKGIKGHFATRDLSFEHHHTAIHMGQGHQRSSCNKNLCTFMFPFLQPFKWVKGIRDHCATRDSTLACHHHYKHSHWSKQLEVNCNERLCTIPSLSLHPLKQVKGIRGHYATRDLAPSRHHHFSHSYVKGIRGHCAAMYKHQHCIHSSWLRVLSPLFNKRIGSFPSLVLSDAGQRHAADDLAHAHHQHNP